MNTRLTTLLGASLLAAGTALIAAPGAHADCTTLGSAAARQACQSATAAMKPFENDPQATPTQSSGAGDTTNPPQIAQNGPPGGQIPPDAGGSTPIGPGGPPGWQPPPGAPPLPIVPPGSGWPSGPNGTWLN